MFIESTNKESGTKFLQNTSTIDCVVDECDSTRLWFAGATEHTVVVRESYGEVKLKIEGAAR